MIDLLADSRPAGSFNGLALAVPTTASSDPAQKADALQRLLEQVESLQDWIARRLPNQVNEPPLDEHVRLLRELAAQDLAPDPNDPGGKRLRIRDGVAAERIISVEDPQMRHGRKSKSKRFNGYKRHLAADLDTRLILACAVTPANRPEEEAAPALEQDIGRQGLKISELHVDRGYINASTVPLVLAPGGQVLCKPWVARNSNSELFTKQDLHVDMRRLTITCPAGQTEHFTPGTTVEFEPEACGCCWLPARCTMAAASGRTVTVAEDERLQHRLRKLVATPKGVDSNCDSESVSSTVSPTWPSVRGAAPDIAALAPTFSTCVAAALSKISRPLRRWPPPTLLDGRVSNRLSL